MSKPIWQYRPSEKEHERALAAMREGGYTSLAGFVREAVLRLIVSTNGKSIVSNMEDAIREIEEATAKLKRTQDGT